LAYTVTVRIIGYARLSAGSEESTSIARQREIIENYAVSRGWDLIDIVEDPSASASQLRLNRPGLTRVRDAIQRGDAQAVVVWRLDRIARSVVDFGTLLDEGTSIVSATEPLDTTTPMGRAMAEILQVFAAMEARATSIRVAGSVDYLRRNARFPGGVVPFGYRSAPNPDGPGRVLVIEPSEAEALRDAMSRVLNGESLVQVSRRLAAQGVPTTRSAYRAAIREGRDPEGLDRGTWRYSGLRDLLVSDAALGRITSRGQLVRDESGAPLQAWEPVLDVRDVLRLRAILADRVAAPRVQQSRLLSGVAYCAHCDSKLYARRFSGNAYYGCSGTAQGLDCPGPIIRADNLDEYVSEQFLLAVGKLPEVEEVEAVRESEASRELADVQAALVEASQDVLSDSADLSVLLPRISSLKARLAELRTLPITTESFIRPTGRTLAEAWHADEDLIERRRLLLQAIDHVAISRRERRGRNFDKSRVNIRWNS